MKKSIEEKKRIIRNTIITLGFIPTIIPICEAGKILLKDTTNTTCQEIDDELLEKTIKELLCMPISLTTMGVVFEQEEKEKEEKKLIK